MKKTIKKYSTQIIVVFLILAILELIFTLRLNFYPFKTANMLISDLYFEYVPFWNYLRDAILNGRNIFTSFSFSMGQNIIGIITYYCLSPLNLILLFSKIDNIAYFVKILFFAKIILSGLSMSIYLNSKTTKLNNILFSLIYAFMTYNIKYGFNIMWLDIIILLPIVILGLEKMIEGKSPKLYIISLTIMIFSNFYLAFSACIFIFIYFLYYSFINKKLNFKLFYKFALFSIIAVLLNAFMLFPTFLNMLGGKVTTAPTNYNRLLLYNPLKIIHNITPGYTYGITPTNDLPYFYSSMFIIVLFINYLFNKDILIREKISSLLVLAIIFLATLFGPLDLLFHCFRVPNNLFYRYAYLLPFFLISVVSKKNIKLSFYSLIPIAILIIWALATQMSTKMILSSVLMLVYFFLIKADLKPLLFITIIAEIIYNLYAIMLLYLGLGNYNTIKQYSELLNEYLPKGNEFYRIEINKPVTSNDSFLIGYYGISSFSPTISESATIFLSDYLHTSELKKINYNYQNRYILDPYFLGIKYEILNNEVKENEYYLPLVVKTNNFDYFKPTDSLIENSNNLYKMINGEYLFKAIDFKIDCIIQKKIVNKECHISYDKKNGYTYYLLIIEDKAKVFANNKNHDINNIIEVDETFNFDYDNIYINDIKLYEFNKDDIKTQTNEFEVVKDNYIRMQINEGSYLLMIPYDEGWHIKINGKEVKKIKVIDSLIGFEVQKGTLEIEYIPRGLNVGIVISGLTFMSLVTYLVRKRSR